MNPRRGILKEKFLYMDLSLMRSGAVELRPAVSAPIPPMVSLAGNLPFTVRYFSKKLYVFSPIEWTSVSTNEQLSQVILSPNGNDLFIGHVCLIAREWQRNIVN